MSLLHYHPDSTCKNTVMNTPITENWWVGMTAECSRCGKETTLNTDTKTQEGINPITFDPNPNVRTGICPCGYFYFVIKP